MKLCVDCRWFIPEELSSPFAYATCSHPKIGRDLVYGTASRTTCERQRHIQTDEAIMFREHPELWCGPEGRYWEVKE